MKWELTMGWVMILWTLVLAMAAIAKVNGSTSSGQTHREAKPKRIPRPERERERAWLRGARSEKGFRGFFFHAKRHRCKLC